MTCNHQVIRKLSDMQYSQFPSFKEGFRFYRCNECGQMMKAKETEIHPIKAGTE